MWIVGPEQKLHMQQVFAVCEQLGIGNREKFKHLSYGAVCNKDGSKMSSRSGEVLSIIELLQEIVSSIHIKMDNDYKSLKDFKKSDQEKIINQIALGSIKYAMLKLEREQDLKFDINEAIDYYSLRVLLTMVMNRTTNQITKTVVKDLINILFKLEQYKVPTPIVQKIKNK